jgi:hypothetical protein
MGEVRGTEGMRVARSEAVAPEGLLSKTRLCIKGVISSFSVAAGNNLWFFFGWLHA